MYLFVRGIATKSVPSQEGERSCICVRGIATKSVPSQEGERSCICVLAVSILPLSMIVLLDFETVPL
jgi:hypothetical protein